MSVLPSEGAQGERLPSSGGSESGASGGACSLLERMALRRARMRVACAAMHAPGVQNAWTEDRLK